MWHYGRGIARLGKKDDASPEAEQAAVEAIIDSGEIKGGGRVSVDDMLALRRRRSKARSRGNAVTTTTPSLCSKSRSSCKDNLAYSEPPPWHHPTRQSLGAVLLEASKPVEAEAVYRVDLKRWTDNGWSTYRLMTSLRMQGKSREADLVEKRFLKAWVRADVALNARRGSSAVRGPLSRPARGSLARSLPSRVRPRRWA